jgi:hypothetical protein
VILDGTGRYVILFFGSGEAKKYITIAVWKEPLQLEEGFLESCVDPSNPTDAEVGSWMRNHGLTIDPARYKLINEYKYQAIRCQVRDELLRRIVELGQNGELA